MKLETI